MFLYGASGHAKVIIDVILSSTNYNIEGIYDDYSKEIKILNYSIINDSSSISLKDKILISIGDNRIRKEIAEKLQTSFCSVIHKTAIISKQDTFIGKGTVIMANVVVNPSVQIGNHCIINTSSIVEHDCVIDDYVHLSPNTVLTGGVSIGEGTHIGAGAIIIPEIKVGKWVIIGAGAVILKDVPDYTTVVGNPGRTIKYKENKYE